MKKYIGLALLLVGSEAIGYFLGEWFYDLFRKTVPAVTLSTFDASASRVAFIGYGLGAGLIIFVWSFLVILVAGFFRKPRAASS